MSRHSSSELSLGTGGGSAVPTRLNGSTAGARAKTVVAASRVAQTAPAFASWARDVLLMTPPDEETPLPDALTALQDANKLVPHWIFNPDAPQYSHTRSMFSLQIGTLLTPEAEASFTTTVTDQELSVDVEYALFLIFGVMQHVFHLKVHASTGPNEADRRMAVDHLTTHLWNYTVERNCVHRVECALQMPNCATTSVEETRPASTVFFRLDSMTLLFASSNVAHACSSIAPRQNTPPVWEYVLHWVTEFNGDGQAIVSKRQTWMGMVSGLYQRRALGFKDHYVFGTTHHSTKLNVYAGRWISDADPPGAAGSGSATEKIIIYTLGTFDMGSAVEMLQYYLLMRATRRLAHDYKVSIDDNARSLALYAGANANIHSWHPAAQPQPSAGDKKRKASSLGSQAAPDAPDANTAPLDTDDYVQQPVHIVEVDNPLMHRFAKGLSENGENAKVRSYLASSIHDDYDYPLPD